MSLPSLPLERFTVIDLTRARSGPTAVRQLAEMGANVIQVAARADDGNDFAHDGFDYQNLHRNKRAIYHSLETDLRKALEFETYAQNICYETEDAREGIRAFVEKRPPIFKGA